MSNYYSADNDAWGGAVAVSSDTAEWKEYPGAVFDGDGTATVVWFQYGNTDPWPTLIYANRYTPASGWGTETAVASVPQNLTKAAPVVDGAGNLFIMWKTNDTGEIYVRRYSAADGWDATPTALYTNAPGTNCGRFVDAPRCADFPSIVADDNGNALAVWSWWEQSTSTGGVSCSRYLVDGGWGDVQAMDNTDGRVYGTSMAVRDNGAATVAWSQHDGTSGTKDILVNRFE